jgi:hypothetical protein
VSLDSLEAIANALLGLAVSTAAVWLLRATGAWETLPAVWVSAVFFCLSLARSRALRALFRRAERAR